ncbi:MAG: trypsin-like peptidase domain-containing protein [Leptolinea sp.]
MKKIPVFLTSMIILTIILSACSFTLPNLTDGKPVENAAPAVGVPVRSAAPTATLVPEGAAAPVQIDTAMIDAYQGTLTSIYEAVNPSVVSIEVASKVNMQNPQLELPFNFPNLPQNPNSPNDNSQQQFQRGLGSGFVWDKEGHIVTNNHVIDGAETIKVTFADGTSLEGKVLGTDKNSDLAVIQIDKTKIDLKPVELADSNKLKVGNLVVAIGNPFGLEGSFSVGVVSALGRSLPVESGVGGQSYSIPDVIQTDAPINPGNSGGVLVNSRGQVVGVPTAIESPVRANAGIGFAVPSAIIQKVIPSLIQDGKFSYTFLGISGGTLTSDLAKAMGLPESQRGILVNAANPNTPADKAGLKGSNKEIDIQGQKVKIGGDVITQIDGQELHRFEDLVSYLARATVVGQQVKLDIIRDGKEMQITVTLEARPEKEKTAVPEDSSIRGNAWLGVGLQNLTPEISSEMKLDEKVSGVLVATVEKDSPADKAGLKGGDKPMDINGKLIMVGGDIITAIDGESVESGQVLRNKIIQANPGDEIKLTVLRESTEKEITVTLGERPVQ